MKKFMQHQAGMKVFFAIVMAVILVSCGKKDQETTVDVQQAVPEKTAFEVKIHGEKTFAGIDMVLIPAKDNYEPCDGAAGKMPQFYIGKYEITQKQYEEVTGSNPSYFKGNPGLPVENVSWYDAIEFCNKLSEKAGYTPCYTIDKENIDQAKKSSGDKAAWKVTFNSGANGFRLPTVNEWEYACAADTDSWTFWGTAVTGEYAVWKENSGGKTQKTGTKKPNPWGLYDMIGNVTEWCFDDSGRQGGYSGSSPIRGGSFQTDQEQVENHEFDSRCTRTIWDSSSSDSKSGFRVVRSYI